MAQDGQQARPKIMRLGEIAHAHESWSKLAELGDLVTPKSTDRAGFIAECDSGALDGVVAVYRTFDSLSITGRWDAELVGHVPKSLRFVSHLGAGYDQLDIDACSAAGIHVSNVPTAVDDATADTAIFLMIGAMRGFWQAMSVLRTGRWRGTDDEAKEMLARAHDPEGKILGFLGMGRIGRNMAKKAKAFDMRIRYHNRTRLDEQVERELGAEYVSFDELLASSDVLSLNLPLNSKTRHIISTAEFAKMKKGVFIVNTARGAVVDERALVRALNDGTVASVGLDVFEHEPAIEQGLLDNPRVMLLPHMGTSSVETQSKMEEWAISNVRRAVTEGKLLSIVPEQAVLGWE